MTEPQCPFCKSNRIQLRKVITRAKTWVCNDCGGTFTIVRNGADWSLTCDGKLLASGVVSIAGVMGTDEFEILGLYEGSAIEPEADEKSWHLPDEGQLPDLSNLRSLGGGIPRRFAHLVSPEDLKKYPPLGSPTRPGKHVLDDCIPDAQEFISSVQQHIQHLGPLLEVESWRLDYSVESAEFIDAAIERRTVDWLDAERFPSLVAYAGETIRLHIGGQWIAVLNHDESRWEPLIRDGQGKRYNPWLDLYKGILEECDGVFSVCIAVAIQSSSTWRPGGSGW